MWPAPRCRFLPSTSRLVVVTVAGAHGRFDEAVVSQSARINFSDATWTLLKYLAYEQGISMSEVLRQAIALEKWCVEAKKAGAHILIEYPNGKVRELVNI
jgi:hypothetical protein